MLLQRRRLRSLTVARHAFPYHDATLGAVQIKARSQLPAQYAATWSTLPPFGSHHSKFFILQYPRRLRFILTSGNLVPRDFLRKTQSIWWQDFPLKQSGRVQSSDFGTQLAAYLAALKPSPGFSNSDGRTGSAMLAEVLQLIDKYDFSAARALLVASIPHKAHTSSDRIKYACISRAV